jgi:hypothetical protein
MSARENGLGYRLNAIHKKQIRVDITQINKLEADILKRAGKPSKRKVIFPKDLDTKRFELLMEHLGYSINGRIPMINVIEDITVLFCRMRELGFQQR